MRSGVGGFEEWVRGSIGEWELKWSYEARVLVGEIGMDCWISKPLRSSKVEYFIRDFFLERLRLRCLSKMELF